MSEQERESLQALIDAARKAAERDAPSDDESEGE